MSASFDGQVVAVVGAAGAFGQRFVHQLAQAGAHVVACTRNPAQLNVPEGVYVASVDITTTDAGRDVVDAAQSEFGKLDGVINATGAVGFGALADTDAAHLEELMLVNALGPLWLTKDVSEALAQQQGFVMHISGVVSEAALPGMAAYCASKAALAAGLVSARRELRRSKVRVFDARPPHTETGLAARALFGTAPKMKPGLNPDAVVSRMLQAIGEGQQELPSADFG